MNKPRKRFELFKYTDEEINIYNQAIEEYDAWVKDRCEGIEEVVCPDNRGDTCVDHSNCMGIVQALTNHFRVKDV